METTAQPALEPASLRRVILAASLGTLFEWYDFYLYGSLAVFFGGLFSTSGTGGSADFFPSSPPP